MVFLPFPIDWATPEMAAARLRPAFLDTLAEAAPHVMQALRDEVLPVYAVTHESVEEAPDSDSLRARHLRYERAHGRRALFCHHRPDLCYWSIVGQAGESQGIDWYPDLLALRTAVEAWAASYHLKEPWICEAALTQLRSWQVDPESAYPRSPWPKDADLRPQPDHLPWSYLGYGYSSSLLLDGEVRLSFECKGWDPHFSTRTEAAARIRATFEQELKRHLDSVEATVRGHPDFERAHKWRELPKYLEWLVRYQCCGESYSDIARTDIAYGSYQTVAQPVAELARLLGLQLRPPTRGRPPGSRDRDPRHTVS